MEGEALAFGFTGPELVVGAIGIAAFIRVTRWAVRSATGNNN